jgi:hypothetical protein
VWSRSKEGGHSAADRKRRRRGALGAICWWERGRVSPRWRRGELGARDDAQGVTQTAVKSCVVLCFVACACTNSSTLGSLRTEGGLTIKDAGDPLDTHLRTQVLRYGKQRTPSNRRDC